MDATDNTQTDRTIDLPEELDRVRDELMQLARLDPELVSTQVKEAGLQREFWRIKQEMAEARDDLKAAIACTREAREWSTTQTRALKQAMADRLKQLEEELAARGNRRAKLKVV